MKNNWTKNDNCKPKPSALQDTFEKYLRNALHSSVLIPCLQDHWEPMLLWRLHQAHSNEHLPSLSQLTHAALCTPVQSLAGGISCNLVQRLSQREGIRATSRIMGPWNVNRRCRVMRAWNVKQIWYEMLIVVSWHEPWNMQRKWSQSGYSGWGGHGYSERENGAKGVKDLYLLLAFTANATPCLF